MESYNSPHMSKPRAWTTHQGKRVALWFRKNNQYQSFAVREDAKKARIEIMENDGWQLTKPPK